MIMMKVTSELAMATRRDGPTGWRWKDEKANRFGSGEEDDAMRQRKKAGGEDMVASKDAGESGDRERERKRKQRVPDAL